MKWTMQYPPGLALFQVVGGPVRSQFFGNLVSKLHGLMLVKEPIRADSFPEPEALFVHTHLPRSTLLRRLIHFDEYVVDLFLHNAHTPTILGSR